MTIIERCNIYLDLLTLDSNTLNDIYAKYVILADSYLGSAGTDIITNNKATFETLLNGELRTFIKYKKNNGELNKLIMENPNLGKFLDPSNNGYIENLVKSLSSNGWRMSGAFSRESLVNALSLFDIPSVTSDEISDEIMVNADVIQLDNNENVQNILNRIQLDDAEVDSLFTPVDTETTASPSPEEPNQTRDINAEVDSIDMDDENPDGEDVEMEAVLEVAVNAQDKAIEKLADDDNRSFDDMQLAVSHNDQQIKSYVEQKEAARKSKEVEDAIKENLKDKAEIDMTIVNSTVKSIIAVYDIIYPDLFQETPAGILTSSGIITVKSDNSLMVASAGSAYAIRLWSSINNKYRGTIRELDYHNDVSLECINPDGTLKYNYAPYFHVHNIYGIYRGQDGTLKREGNWNKFRAKLVRSLTENVTKLLSSFKGDQLTLSMSLIELFTTMFIAEDFDVTKSIKLSIKSIAISNKFGNCLDIGKMIASGDAFPCDPTSVEIVNNSESDLGITNVLTVFDKKAYNSEILFAYKPLSRIIASGGKVGLSKTLLGRDVKGRNVTYNFASPQAVDSLIIAGSGSGKGVVTLNILATFIAEGCPTVYVDWKPDMAAMLWNLERSTGARILSIDGLAGVADGVVPVRDYGTGVNKPNIPNISDKLNVIPYLKAFQLMVLCATGRNISYNGMSARGKKMQFILDEAQAMNKQLGLLKTEMEKFLKDNKPTKERPITAEYKYVERLQKVLDSLFSGSVEFRNTTGRTGNVGLIMLGQQSDCSAWATGTLKRDPFGFLVGNCSMKMLGKGAADNTKYSLNGAVPAGNNLLGNMGYFALIDGALADKGNPDSAKVVKTYLVLNENDYNENNPGKFTNGMLANVIDPVLRESLINNDFYPMDENGNRYVNKLVGFQGLVEYIGSNIPNFNLNANLEAGYRECEKLLSGLGIVGENGAYSCIEEYLFDCSQESLFTTSELKDLMVRNETISSLIDLDAPGCSGGPGSPGGFADGAPSGGFSIHDTGDEIPKTTNEATAAAARAATAGAANKQGNIDNERLPREVKEMLDRANRIKNEQSTNNTGDIIGEAQHDPVNTTAVTSPVDQSSLGSQDTQGSGVPYQAEDDQEVPEGFSRTKSGNIVPDAPGTLPINETPTFQYGGKSGKAIFVTPEKTTKILGLSKENSVLVEMPPYATSERFSNRLFKTLWGSRYEFKSRWKEILDGFSKHIKADLVKRAIISEDSIVFNKRMLAAINILGGQDDIRVEDIVDFGMTAKKFKNISELMLDQTVFEAAQIELGNPVDGLFNTFINLNRLIITTVDHTEVTKIVTRQEWMEGRMDPEISKAAAKAKFKNQMEAIVATKNPNLRKKSPGYQNRVYTSCMKFQGEGWGSARDAIMSKNPKLFKAAGMSVLTLGILGVGLTAGVIGKVGSLFRR